MLHAVRFILVVAAGSLVTAAAVPPVVASDSAPAGGRAASSGTVLDVTLGSLNLAINVDELDARRADQASASMILGRSGTDEVGKVQARSAGKDRDAIGPGGLSLGANISLDIAEGAAEASLESEENATATVSTTVVDASIAPGASAGQIQQTARAFAGAGHSRAVRTITIENLDVLSVRDLLDGLGLGVLSLSCDQIESLSTTLGATATAACALLADVTNQMDLTGDLLLGAESDAQLLKDTTDAAIALQDPIVSDLQDLVSTLTAQRNDLQGQLSGLVRSEVEDALADVISQIAIVEPACTDLGLLCDTLAALTADQALYTAQIAAFDTLDTVLADLAAAEASLAIEQAALDALLATLAAANSVLDALAAVDLGELPTCSEAASALDEVGGITPALAGAAATLATDVDAACDALAGAIDDVLGTRLLSLSGLEITLDTRSKKESATATIEGAIGSVALGDLTPIALGLPLGMSMPVLDAASDALSGEIQDVLTTLGIGLVDIDLTLFDIDRSTKVAADGSSEGAASMTVLSLRIDATPVTMPASAPLAPMAGSVPGASETAGDVTTSPLAFDMGLFEVSSSFPVAAVGGPTPPPPGGGSGCVTNCSPLPLTGVGSTMELGLLLLFASVLLGRFARSAG